MLDTAHSSHKRSVMQGIDLTPTAQEQNMTRHSLPGPRPRGAHTTPSHNGLCNTDSQTWCNVSHMVSSQLAEHSAS
jgi:hypothetical protein